MTNSKLTDLMKEVLEWMRYHECGGDDGQCLCNRYDLEDRIKAALAEGLTGNGKWIQCTSESNECLGGCRSMREHDSYRQAQLQRERDEARTALAERQDKPICSCSQPYPCMKGCPDCCHSQGYLDYCQGDSHAESRDSAKDIVESEVEWNNHNAQFSTAYPDDETSLTVSRFDLTRQEWRWNLEREIKRKGFCATEAEAKSAAIAAARGLR